MWSSSLAPPSLLQLAVIGIDEEDEITFTISSGNQTYHFQGQKGRLYSVSQYEAICGNQWLPPWLMPKRLQSLAMGSILTLAS